MSTSGDRLSLERLARLDDYVGGHLDDAGAAGFEAEMFEAAGAGDFDDGTFLDELARMSALFDRAGGFTGGGSYLLIEQLRAAGTKVHYVDLGSGGVADFPRWAAGTEIVAARLDLDVRGYETVDVEVETADGRPIKVFREVACDPADGALYAICQEPLARLAFGTARIISRVVGTRAGKRETVAVFDVRPG